MAEPFVTDLREGEGPFPPYSFVIPTYNAVGTIEPLLASLELQQSSGIEFEVVACDDCSTDETPRLLEQHPLVRMVSTPENGGPSVARNEAARNSLGDYMIFLDADVVLKEDTLAQVHAFRTEHPDVGAFHWPMTAEVLAPGIVGLYKTLIDRYMTRVGGRGGTHAVTFMSCRGGLMRRELFFDAGGFDPRYKRADIEDWEFSRRLSPLTTIMHTDRLTIHHHQSPSFVTNLRNYFRRAFLFTRLLARSKKMDNYTETTPLNSLGTLSTLPALLCLPAFVVLGVLRFDTASIVCGMASIVLLWIHFAVNARFYLYALKEKGLLYIYPVLALRFIYSLACACGVALAVLLWPAGGWPFERR